MLRMLDINIGDCKSHEEGDEMKILQDGTVIKVLHINCNYMTTSLHQTMIEHLDEFTENTVFCPEIKGCKPTIEANNNVVAVECFSKIDRLLYFRKQRKIARMLESSVCMDDFDVIHAYTLLTDGNCAMRMSEKYGKPYVVAIRDTDINDFFRLKPYLIPLGIKIMEKASRIFFLSESYKQLMLEKYVPEKKRSILEAKMAVVPNGIDDFWLENRYMDRNVAATLERLKNKNLNAVCVGQIIKRKNIPMIQTALRMMEKDGWKVHLDVIGKKVDETEYKRIASYSNTTYHPPVPKEQLIDYYRKNDIFVLASHTETFGLVYAEAMSQGLPVVYTKGQGFDGQFPEGTVGYRVEPNNPERIARAISSILSDYTKFTKKAYGGSEKFNWKIITKSYLREYIDLTGGERKNECKVR